MYAPVTSLVAQTVKHLPTMRETRLWSLGWEDPLEKEMATYSSTLAWKIPWMKERGKPQPMGSQRVWHDWATSLSLSCTSRIFRCCSSRYSAPGMGCRHPGVWLSFWMMNVFFFNLHIPGDSSINVLCILFNLHLIAYGYQNVIWAF